MFLRSKLASRIFWKRKKLREFIYSPIAYIKAYWWGIKIGKKCRFDGRIHFYKYPGSSIIIGDRCRFNSLSISTMAGISRPCSIWTTSSDAILKIGNDCGFSGTVISCHSAIIIEENVMVGSNVLIMDSDQHPSDIRSGHPKKVVLKKNCWIGSNCIILKGVTVGRNSVIGAGSVVTRSIPDNVIAAGVPARPLRYLEENSL